MAVIELLDGPLKGTLHEVQGGWPVPDTFGLPGGDGWRHNYRTNDDRVTANHIGCEAMTDPRIHWNYVADGKPTLPEDFDSVFVLMSKRAKDGTLTTWSGHYTRGDNFKALKGHKLFGVYAWAYLPEPAPYIEPEPTAACP